MNIFDALGFVKEYAQNFAGNISTFFSRYDGDPENKISADNVMASAIICLVIGVTFQDRFISGKGFEDIIWFDRAITQIIFWFTLALLASFLLMIGRKNVPREQAFYAAFQVLPISFMCGAYGASLAHFFLFLSDWAGAGPLTGLPALTHVAVQLVIVALFFARELKIAGEQNRLRRMVTTFVIFSAILIVDLVVIYGP